MRPSVGDELQAFLPGPVETSFPTVRAYVCRTDEAREFLESLDLTEPDPVDNVIRNVLPKYRNEGADLSEADYASDADLILGAAETDSRTQQDRLVRALGGTPWVKAVDGSGRRGLWAKPGNLYFATQRLRSLFNGVGDVLLVDLDVSCLTGEEARRLLERSGATRYLKPVKVRCDLTEEQLDEIRRREGLETRSWGSPEDKTIRGLGALLDMFAALDPNERLSRARDLWNALGDLNKRRGSRPFEGVYAWGYFHQRKVASFDSALVRVLNKRRWVPDSSGNLRKPGLVAFEETGWEANSFLQSKIHFEPPMLDDLAREAGIERGALDLLREMGVTSEAELRTRLGVNQGRKEPGVVERDDDSAPPPENGSPRHEDKGESDGDGSEPVDAAPDRPSPNRSARRQFVSYVGVAADGEDTDADGLEHSARMELERLAIKFILDAEPDWQPTPPNNPGFDLYRGATIETATHWCEVKAMKGTLDDRDVGISSAQFEWARNHGEAYWLYVVERAGTDAPNLVRIQDPVGRAKTFTFDHGWRAVGG